jgi:hypothetical protein
MSKIKKQKKENANKSPSNLLKNGIDSIVFLFENKNNEYHKNISEYQIIINNLQIKNKNLTKENYILKNNNIRQNQLIEELRNENNKLKNIINNIKGKLNIDLSLSNIKDNNIKNNNSIINNNIINNSIINNNNIINKSIINNKINKLNKSKYLDNNNRTRNISNISGPIPCYSNKDNFLTDRFHRKNNVLGNNIIKKNEFRNNKRLFVKKKLENDLSFNDYLLKIKDNYYSRQRSRQRTKNNSFNQNTFSNDLNNSNDYRSESKNILIKRREIRNKLRFNSVNNINDNDNDNVNDGVNLRSLNNLAYSNNLLDNYINDSKKVQIYNTIELY